MPDDDREWTRIIPTRMGTSYGEAGTIRRHQDHPHAYGDKTIQCIAKFYIVGSSPRVWGQVRAEFAEQERRRIIPTRMGTRRS